MAARNAPYRIAIARRGRSVSIDVRSLHRVADLALRYEHVLAADLSIVLVDDREMQRLNKQFLKHDYPTDVVSFLLESSGDPRPHSIRRRAPRRGAGKSLHGEIVIGVDFAARSAAEYGWTAQCEVLLYLVHGLLHLCGYDDLSPTEKRIMRRRETAILRRCGIIAVPRRRPRSHGPRPNKPDRA